MTTQPKRTIRSKRQTYERDDSLGKGKQNCNFLTLTSMLNVLEFRLNFKRNKMQTCSTFLNSFRMRCLRHCRRRCRWLLLLLLFWSESYFVGGCHRDWESKIARRCLCYMCHDITCVWIWNCFHSHVPTVAGDPAGAKKKKHFRIFSGIDSAAAAGRRTSKRSNEWRKKKVKINSMVAYVVIK